MEISEERTDMDGENDGASMGSVVREVGSPLSLDIEDGVVVVVVVVGGVGMVAVSGDGGDVESGGVEGKCGTTGVNRYEEKCSQ